ncbi:uncharacterized protein LOC122262840 [Penaeus japonicus]|uniref:uncharacterized protein LOC122262840 n=1 Tax=Penaeus japonicus TaxID=27405 RepID=UPI001C71327D|nr:uncharacterized protein LOC122262840 [Penaeus japonicus]
MKIKDCWNLVMSKEGCGKKHSNYLHLPSRRPDEGDATPETPNVPVTVTSAMSHIPQNPSVNPRVSNFVCSQGGKLAQPILPARVRCLDTSAIVDTYAMFDPGTNTTYCSEQLCGKLIARGVTRHMELATIAQTRMPVETTIITLLVTDLGDTQEPYCIPEVTIRPTLNIDLSGLSNRVEIQRWPHLKNLEIPELETKIHLCSTIPRLELAGVVRLDKLLQDELEMPLEESVYWTDSTIVLWYLQSNGKRFQTYVANRVAKILDHTTPTQWRHVPTSETPGDDASIGMTAEDLVCNERWSKGPAFLYQKRSNWPRQPAFNCIELENLAEVKPSPVVYITKAEEDHTSRLLNYYSSWHRMKKAVAWLLRLHLVLCKKSHQKGPLVADELRTAGEAIIRHAQKMLEDEKKTQLGKLNPKKSSSGLLLVGGRLTNSKQEESTKHQLILPYEHPVSRLIVEDYHQKAGHSGVERILADTRRYYWILKGRKLVKKVVHRCLTCRRFRGKTKVQQMLITKLMVKTIWLFTGIWGLLHPYMVKEATPEVKRLYFHLPLRAVHIEVANTLDTNSFINVLERFMA